LEKCWLNYKWSFLKLSRYKEKSLNANASFLSKVIFEQALIQNVNFQNLALSHDDLGRLLPSKEF
jgi:hypothetical protein